MGIEDDDIARVRDASDIVQVIGEYTSLRRVGRRWQALCPFHAEKSPSFSVNYEQGLYYCFGCGAKGDVITFVREKEHLDFVAAVEKLAARAGVTLRYTDEHEGESRRRRQVLSDALDQAVAWYHERLLAAPDAAPARKYLRSRGLSGDEVRRYRLGWAPDSWDELARALRVPAEVFIDAGLGFRNRSGRLTDAFRGRVLFPIFDVGDRPVAFGGRILPPEWRGADPSGADGPKYKNSAESQLYAKSKVLYGLNWAKAEVVAADQVIVCEGYTDVIGFAAAGVPRAVATCGTALTEEHVRVLTAYAKRIVLAFDADAAGQGAAARFYEWERRYAVDVSVAMLPAGVDPADLARRDPGALRAAVDGAQPFLGFRVARLLEAASAETPEGRARVAESVLEAIREHPNALVRDQYVMEVASRTRIDLERLRADLERRPRTPAVVAAPTGRSPRGPRRGAAGEADAAPGPDDGDPGPGGIWAAVGGRPEPVGRRAEAPQVREGSELEALRLLVIRPDEIAGWLHDGLFADERALAAYRALISVANVREAIDIADPGAADLLRRVAAEDTDSMPDDVVDLLVRAATGRVLDDYRGRLRQDTDAAAFATYAGVVSAAKLQLEALGDPSSREEARDQLLAWLLQELRSGNE
jgi:DNA primase